MRTVLLAAGQRGRWATRRRRTSETNGGSEPPDQEIIVKRYLSPAQPWALSALLMSTLLLVASDALAQAPSIEGTYRLVSRTLRDGTVLKPPDVMGLQTYTKSYRNFNILSKDPDGQFVSRSIVATYTLTPTDYIETTLFHILVRGTEVRREVSTQPERSSVSLDARRIEIRRSPTNLEQRVTVFEGHKFTATSPVSVDLWERVE